MYGYIYKITVNNPESIFHQCYYIGQSRYNKKKKVEHYWGSSAYLINYRKKYHTQGLDREILCECTNEEELNLKEKEYIGDLYITDAFIDGGKCLNMISGGQYDYYLGKEAKRKVLKNSKDSQWKKDRIPWNKGIKYTDEQKVNIIKANKTNPTYGHLGKLHSKETRKKISEMQKDFVWWTNDIEERHCEECPGEDFHRGRLHREIIHRNAYNNGIICKWFVEDPGEGWTRGFLVKNKIGEN